MEALNNVCAMTVIELDHARNLKFDFNALAHIEKASGRNMLDGASWTSLDASTLRVFVWAGLLHEDAKLTIEQVGSMIHPGNVKYVSEKLSDAIQASLPKQEVNPQQPAVQ